MNTVPRKHHARLQVPALMIAICVATNLSCVSGNPKLDESRKLSLSVLSVPSEPAIPKDWPDSIEISDSLGSVEKQPGKIVYVENFTRGWNETILEYDTELEKALRQLTDKELAANRDGRDACYKQLSRLEQIHGRSKLKSFIQRNSKSFGAAY